MRVVHTQANACAPELHAACMTGRPACQQILIWREAEAYNAKGLESRYTDSQTDSCHWAVLMQELHAAGLELLLLAACQHLVDSCDDHCSKADQDTDHITAHLHQILNMKGGDS